MIDVFCATFIIVNIIWIFFFPIALLLENRYWVQVLDTAFGKAPTYGILVRNGLCMWIWPLALVAAGPRIIQWMKQPR